jgi:hypothetical protein
MPLPADYSQSKCQDPAAAEPLPSSTAGSWWGRGNSSSGSSTSSRQGTAAVSRIANGFGIAHHRQHQGSTAGGGTAEKGGSTSRRVNKMQLPSLQVHAPIGEGTG